MGIDPDYNCVRMFPIGALMSLLEVRKNPDMTYDKVPAIVPIASEWSPPSVSGSWPFAAWPPTAFATASVTFETSLGFFNLPIGGSEAAEISSNW